MTIAKELQNLDVSGQIVPVVSLPEVPLGMYGNGKEAMQVAAWETIWDWCNKYGLAQHSYEFRGQYDKLNGPQKIAQWIIDMKSALYFFEQLKEIAAKKIGGADSDARRTHSSSVGVAMCDGETPEPAMATEAEPSLSRCDSGPIV